MMKYVVLLTLVTLQLADALYFHIAETERKCFIEEIPDETTVIGNNQANLLSLDSCNLLSVKINGFQWNIRWSCTIRVPADLCHRHQASECTSRLRIRTIRSYCLAYTAQTVRSAPYLFWLRLIFNQIRIGKISFTSHTPGEHVICMYSNSTAWFSGSQLRVHLDIQVGEHAIDYANVAQKEKMSELQVRIRQLLDQVEQITKEQNYQRVIFRFKNYWSFFSYRFRLLCVFSTVRSDSDRQARAPIAAFYGGLWPRQSSWLEWVSGRCAISSVSLRRKNWYNFGCDIFVWFCSQSKRIWKERERE